MIGLILWKAAEKGRRNVQIGEESLLHMRFFCAHIVPGRPAALRRRLRSAAKALRNAGVTRVVLPEAFPYGEQLAQYGLSPVSTLALRRSLASDLVRAALAQRGCPAHLAVAGDHLTGELVRTVTELALRSRYILLDLPYGGEELARQLRREYGVSVLLHPSREQLASADALVLFDPREELPADSGVVLRLYEGTEDEPLPPLLLPPLLEEQLPAGCCRAQLLAALWEGGLLRPGQIVVEPAKADQA